MVGEANKSRGSLNAQPAPNPNGQRHPQAPLAPKNTLDTGGAGKFVGPNDEIIVRLG